MAKKKETPIQDNTWWYSDQAFMPPEDKNELWCAQMLFYMKMNSSQLVSDREWVTYNKIERLEIDPMKLKEMIDPKTPMGKGGTAEYFAADWKGNPIDIHLDNIARAKLDKISENNEIDVSEIDKFAKSQKQRDTDKIIYQRELRNLINSVVKDLGLPEIKSSQSPYDYIKGLAGDKEQDVASDIDNMLDYIRSQISTEDGQDMALYQTYIYKGDIERAFELGIKHYLVNLNKWHIKCEYFNNDLLKFNRCCGIWYVDETSGRGTVEYVQPNQIRTSFFKERNGEDIVYWFYEKLISFSEFVRQFGVNLSKEELKEVFELNKLRGGNHGMEWKSAFSAKGANARISIGYASVLTQDADKFSQEYVNNRVPIYKRKPLTWEPSKYTRNEYKQEVVTKIYNVWYGFYYIPPPEGKMNSNKQIDWAWQSRYIFNIRKEIDMYRYGVDLRYAKSRLVIWKDDRPSYYDIKQAYMPKINTMWQKFQNSIIQDLNAVVFDQDLMMGLLKAVDEGNAENVGDPEKPTGGSGVNAAMQVWQQLRQGGMAFMKLRDSQGNITVDPSKLIIPVDSKHLDKAEKYLKIMLDVYNMMTAALAQSDISEGQDAKPRTPVAGIQASLMATNFANWFIEKPAREVYIMYAERCVQHILCMIQERKKYGYNKRWEEFSNVIGLSHILMFEGIEDMTPEEIGITISLEDRKAYQQWVIDLANKMADDGEVGRDVVSLVINQVKVNYKYAYVLLMIAAKKKAKEKADQEDLAHQRQMELLEMQNKNKMQIDTNRGATKDQNIKTQGEVNARLIQLENQVKALTMAGQKQQLKDNKLDEQNNQARIERENKTYNQFAPENA